MGDFKTAAIFFSGKNWQRQSMKRHVISIGLSSNAEQESHRNTFGVRTSVLHSGRRSAKHLDMPKPGYSITQQRGSARLIDR